MFTNEECNGFWVYSQRLDVAHMRQLRVLTFKWSEKCTSYAQKMLKAQKKLRWNSNLRKPNVAKSRKAKTKFLQIWKPNLADAALCPLFADKVCYHDYKLHEQNSSNLWRILYTENGIKLKRFRSFLSTAGHCNVLRVFTYKVLSFAFSILLYIHRLQKWTSCGLGAQTLINDSFA